MAPPHKIKRLPYRLCVGAMVLNSEGYVWAGHRADVYTDLNAWQMPQGGIDGDETPQEAVLRECNEEMGTDRVEILAESCNWYTYDLPKDLIKLTWKGKFRGQKQKWFVLRFLGEDTDINLKAAQHPEFNDWQWVSLDELTERVIPFKREVYKSVITEFRQIAEKIS